MEKTCFEKFLEKPYWYRVVAVFIFFYVVIIICGLYDTGKFELIMFDDVFTFAMFSFVILVITFCMKSIYNSIFGRWDDLIRNSKG